MSAKSVLGRGVGALLPEDLTGPGEEKFFQCDIDKIEPNPEQPRKHFDEERLQRLAESIAEKGVIQPLLVSRAKGNRFRLIAGERRWRAAQAAGLETSSTWLDSTLMWLTTPTGLASAAAMVTARRAGRLRRGCVGAAVVGWRMWEEAVGLPGCDLALGRPRAAAVLARDVPPPLDLPHVLEPFADLRIREDQPQVPLGRRPPVDAAGREEFDQRLVAGGEPGQHQDETGQPKGGKSISRIFLPGSTSAGRPGFQHNTP